LPLIAVGWTLNIEMFFYLLFALSLKASRAAAPLLSATVLIVLFYMQASGSYHSQILATWGHDYVIFFVFGMGVFYLWSAIEPLVQRNGTLASLVTRNACERWVTAPAAC
jgi:exopolysaccharide production protein ExoZ